MRRLTGWLGFALKAMLVFLALAIGASYLGRYYPAFTELWALIALVGLYSLVVAVVAAGKVQQEEDEQRGL